jgi:pimeloyl-ACP methyl ester carboxylesterase
MTEPRSEGGAPDSRMVRAGPVSLRVLNWSGRRGYRPFLLLHGLASNARFWEFVAARLSAAGHAVIAPDLRGHGQSDKPSAGYDFDTVADDVAALVGTVGIEDPIVAGHSWGGMIALHLATRTGIAGAALIDGGIAQISAAPGATWEAAQAALTPPRLAGVRLDDFLRRLGTMHPEWVSDPQIRDIVLANFEIRSDRTIAPHLTFERHMRIVRHIWDFPTYDEFDQVRCPILMIAARPPGDLHPEAKTYLDLKRRGELQARSRIARLEFVWMDTGHDIPLERPQELADRLLAFSAEVRGRGD